VKAFNKTIDHYLTFWNQQEPEKIQINQTSSLVLCIKQTHHYLRLKRQMNQVCKKIKNQPTLDLSNDPSMQRLFELWLGVDSQVLKQKIHGDYAQCTRSFIERVKNRWENMPEAAIFQALRNVWIMNTIQIIHGIPVELTNAIFAYSMLYPLTDNYLDDEKVSLSEKQAFSIRFRNRLEGLYIEPSNAHEEDIFEMVNLIEKQFSRIKDPAVFESLLMIYEGQCMSLQQQYENLSEKAILRLSFKKGGASVVADAYLVLGNLNEDQMMFYTGYGIALQLADDLQDLKEDLQHHHKTLYNYHSNLKKRWMDTIRLMALCDEILDAVPIKENLLKEQMINLLRNSLQLLVCDSVYEHKDYFSQNVIRQISGMQRLGLKHHWKLKQRGYQWIEELKPILSKQMR